jgi:hypothetical protein
VRRSSNIWQEAKVEKEYSQLSVEEGHTAYGPADALLHVLRDIRSPRRYPIQMLCPLPRSLLLLSRVPNQTLEEERWQPQRSVQPTYRG